ncbi:SpvB/TcaC N-terminal domain-containing protein [Sandaracinus amylolyticus]|uniref:SpvB/TcaC N-terminal domain-containing protein n=1 Tax=Sandaracinus amylolyticus TaxID=927083 RepID=UPI001F38A664|nr:SpvB/TcaC N-terminal domain-containing protein [Sandaracinus amylolyticus]
MSDDRVVLPDGPGSIEGIGDNVSVDGNMGAMSYSIPIEAPQGYEGMTPELALSYSSSAGAGLLGVGWSMRVPSIERLTLRGLPRYVADDEFAADGAEQLVRVSRSGDTAVYRARFERGFVRYTWRAVGDGSAGYWTAEYPDGRIGYFGATAAGTLVHEARLEAQDGDTFRYLLVEMVDVHGHSIRYEYEKTGVTPLLRRVGWVFEAGSATPRYAIELEYEARPDPISDAQPGFEERITERLWLVRVRSRGEAIRAYRLTYEDMADSGGFSRVRTVEQIGRDGGVYPVAHRFGYSRSLGGVCGEARCDRPFVVDMGTLSGAAGIGTGDATLVDINGDALPDLVDSSRTGPHRFYVNVLEGAGRARFDSASVDSTTTSRSGFELSQPYVKILDVNGDGFADLVNARTAQVRCNHASGDWTTSGCGVLSEQGFTLEDDGVAGDGDSDPVRTRFVDLNGDRRIDILRTNGATDVQAWLNTGSGFTALAVQPIGRVFDGDRLQLADMNGDGLLDPVVVEAGTVRYRLALGWGRWGDWVTVEGPSIGSDSAMNDTELQDLNGDGLDDLVIVQGSTVRYAINRNAGRFDPFVTIGAGDVDGGLPVREPTTTVLFADMNGSGSQDPVWVGADGRVRFLELFPVRPNLMSRLENGLGLVHEITYGTSVAHQAASETPWRYTLPHAMQVVDRTDTWVTLTGGDDGEGLHEVIESTYRDGFYDGIEKAFRGFARVERRLLAEMSRDSQEPALTIEEYLVEDPYFTGLLSRRAVLSGDDLRPLSEERHEYDDCEVAQVPTSGLRFAVHHACETSVTTIRQEGAEPDAWATTRVEYERNGYGQVVRTTEHGVAHMGAPESPVACGACDADLEGTFGAACGDECSGDERIEVRELIEPGRATGDRWILGRAHTVRRFAREGGPATEERTYYDGSDFVGLAHGTLELGMPTRVTSMVREGETVDTQRNAYDAHGNVIATLDPLGAPDDESAHRRSYTYDAAGLRVLRVEVHVATPEGEPYRLRQEYAYEPAFDKVVESTAWMIDGAGATSPRNPTYYAYDEFARVVAIAKPGDTLERPTLEVTWELDAPASRIVVRQRSEAGGELDIESVQCADGRGRVFLERTRIAEGEWMVNGFTELNRRGAEVRIYQPYTDSSGACAFEPPTGVAHVDVQYDGAQREILRTMPDAALYGSASIVRTEHLPLATITHDENDSDAESPHHGTPDAVHVDGLDRPIAIERVLRTEAGLERAVTRLFYDAAGSLAGYVDALGNVKRQDVDLLGRVVRIEDPNTGVITFEHDAAGNVIARTDARGITARTEYDGANRPLVSFDADEPEATRIEYRYDLPETCDATRCTNAAAQLVEASYPLPAELAELVGGARGFDHVGYDARGRVGYEARVLGAARFETRTRFDGVDRPVETVFPDGQRMTRRFDGASRLVGIDGLIERIERDARGLVARIVRADGSEDSMEYDALMRLARLSSVDASGGAMQDYAYDRDRHGLLLGIEDGAELPSGFASASARYAYDAWYRLRGAELEAGTERAETLAWTYDAIDNTLSAVSSLGATSVAHVGDYEYDRPGVASRAGELVMEHDVAGFLTQRGELGLAWDFLGRLVSASREGEPRGVFAYGPDQRRVAKIEDGAVTIYAGADFEVRDGVSRVYARIERDRVARAQSTAMGVSIYGDPSDDGEVDAGDAWLARAEQASRASRHHAAARRFLHEAAPEPVQLFHDHLGSLAAATREGERVGLRRYHAFGEIRADDGFVDERGFTGQERDASTGLSAFEWRYLDTRAGRWSSADPAFESVTDDVVRVFEGIGRYGYVSANPINAIDPTGLMFERLTSAFNAVAPDNAGPLMRAVTNAAVSLAFHYAQNDSTTGAVVSSLVALGGTALEARQSMKGGASMGSAILQSTVGTVGAVGGEAFGLWEGASEAVQTVLAETTGFLADFGGAVLGKAWDTPPGGANPVPTTDVEQGGGTELQMENDPVETNDSNPTQQ